MPDALCAHSLGYLLVSCEELRASPPLQASVLGKSRLCEKLRHANQSFLSFVPKYNDTRNGLTWFKTTAVWGLAVPPSPHLIMVKSLTRLIAATSLAPCFGSSLVILLEFVCFKARSSLENTALHSSKCFLIHSLFHSSQQPSRGGMIIHAHSWMGRLRFPAAKRGAQERRGKRRSRGSQPPCVILSSYITQCGPRQVACHRPRAGAQSSLGGKQGMAVPHKAVMQQGGPLDHLMEGRTQGNAWASSVFVKSSKVRTIGCTGEGTRSPLQVGCMGEEEAEGRRETHASQTLRNVLCAPWAEAGAHQNNGSGLGPASLCSLLPTFRAQGQERDPQSHSACHGSTGESSATFLPTERPVWGGAGWGQGP